MVLTLGTVFLLNLTCVLLLYKELKISSFDPALATTLGINARWMHYLLMSVVVPLPAAFGYQSTHTAGMMALMSGLFLALAMVFAPRQGILSRARFGRRKGPPDPLRPRTLD